MTARATRVKVGNRTCGRKNQQALTAASSANRGMGWTILPSKMVEPPRFSKWSGYPFLAKLSDDLPLQNA